jgi:4a-hydroxytetrahydrobiopterin dehydratase
MYNGNSATPPIQMLQKLNIMSSQYTAKPMELQKEKCVPCQGGMPTVTDKEIDLFFRELQHWSVVEKSFKFKDFAEALAFTNKVGKMAEKEGHHPDILTEWGKVTVSWWTHKINGLHKNDFVMAAKTDSLS